MKELFEEVYKIASKDHLDLSKHLNKLYEETGELAQVINKLIGIKTKKKGDTKESIIENISEEIADSIQILFIIAKLNGIEYLELKNKLKEKNDIYLKSIDSKKGKKIK